MILFQDINISVYGRIWLFQGFIILPSHVTPWLSIGFTRHLQLLLIHKNGISCFNVKYKKSKKHPPLFFRFHLKICKSSFSCEIHVKNILRTRAYPLPVLITQIKS